MLSGFLGLRIQSGKGDNKRNLVLLTCEFITDV